MYNSARKANSNVLPASMRKGANHFPENGKKVALYIRVSTEEQAENPEGSIRNQEERLKKHFELKNYDNDFGNIAGTYVDAARSGKNLDRPELIRLMNDIAAGSVNLVMVSELSRLSRSIRDFCQIWELMREHGCSFLSLREQFDTTSAAGELMLFNIVNFAQFERRQVSERVFANFTVRAERGLYNGGQVPFGYALNPNDKGVLLIDEEHSKIVQEIFQVFLKKESLSVTARTMNDRGFRMERKARGSGVVRLGIFTLGNVHNILKNKAYIGIRVYRGEVVGPAAWQPIIKPEVFDEVEKVLKKNFRRNKRPMAKRFPFLVSGILHCGTCNKPLAGTTANGNGGKFIYYEHGWNRRLKSVTSEAVHKCEGRNRFQGHILEPLVWAEVESLIRDKSVAKKLLAQARKSFESVSQAEGIDELRKESLECDEHLERLTEHLVEIPKGVSPKPIFTKMEKLETKKSDLKQQIIDMEAAEPRTESPVALDSYSSFLASFEPLLQQLTPELKAEIVKILVSRIEVFDDRVSVEFYVGEQTILEKHKKSQKILAETKKGPEDSFLSTEPFKSPTRSALQSGSSTLKNGDSLSIVDFIGEISLMAHCGTCLVASPVTSCDVVMTPPKRGFRHEQNHSSETLSDHFGRA